MVVVGEDYLLAPSISLLTASPRSLDVLHQPNMILELGLITRVSILYSVSADGKGTQMMRGGDRTRSLDAAGMVTLLTMAGEPQSNHGSVDSKTSETLWSLIAFVA